MKAREEFLIIKYYNESPLFTLGRSATWGKVTPHKNKEGWYCHCQEIERGKALDLIKSAGLTRISHSHKEGDVYDTPNQDFLKKYGNDKLDIQRKDVKYRFLGGGGRNMAD